MVLLNKKLVSDGIVITSVTWHKSVELPQAHIGMKNSQIK